MHMFNRVLCMGREERRKVYHSLGVEVVAEDLGVWQRDLNRLGNELSRALSGTC